MTLTRARSKAVSNFVIVALKNYLEHNKGSLPERIVVYRDGVGGPTLAEKCVRLEIQEVISVLETFDANYHP